MATESVQSLPIMKVATSQDESEISTLSVPAPMQGGLLKKRRFPSKGWIKRYFSLADGILKYAVNYAHSTKLKYHGIFDLGKNHFGTFFDKNAPTESARGGHFCQI